MMDQQLYNFAGGVKKVYLSGTKTVLGVRISLPEAPLTYSEALIGTVALIERLRAATDEDYQWYFIDPQSLFRTIDHRALRRFVTFLQQSGIAHNRVGFDLEPPDRSNDDVYLESLKASHDAGFRISICGFRAGLSALGLVGQAVPDFLFFDAPFVQDAVSDIRMRNSLSHMVGLCRIFGIRTGCDAFSDSSVRIAYGAGVDLISCLPEHLKDFDSETDMRNATGVIQERTVKVRQEMSFPETIPVDADYHRLFDVFQRQPGCTFVPVLDSAGIPLGIISERDIKRFAYAPYGRDLLQNRTRVFSLHHLIVRAPVCDIAADEDAIIEAFVNHPDADGVIITERMLYRGFLSARSLLTIINERKLAFARDMNPLSRLPGNVMIERTLAALVSRCGMWRYCVYFDFDNFKPFNDSFGFRQGDRAIVVFSEMLAKSFAATDEFAGHVGGDDFIVLLSATDSIRAEVADRIRALCSEFADFAAYFFTDEDRARGWYCSTGRDGSYAEFPLLLVSVAMIEVPPEVHPDSEAISRAAMHLKKKAKDSPDGESIMRFDRESAQAINDPFGGR
jgi:GGDEF domain-containing protein